MCAVWGPWNGLSAGGFNDATSWSQDVDTALIDVISALLGANLLGIYPYDTALEAASGTLALLIVTIRDLTADVKYGLTQTLLLLELPDRIAAIIRPVSRLHVAFEHRPIDQAPTRYDAIVHGLSVGSISLD